MASKIIPLVAGGSGATATASIVAAGVGPVTVTAGGSGYIVPPTVAATASGLSGSSLVANLTNGVVTSITVVAAGSGGSGAVTITITSAAGGVVTATGTGALAPTAGADISTLTGGTITVCVEVISLTAAKTCEVALELSTNGFSGSVFAWTQQFIGQEGPGGTTYVPGAYNPSTDKRSVVVRQQLPSSAANYFGQASAVARMNVTAIDGSALVALNAWIEVG